MKKLLTVIASTALLSLSVSTKAADSSETDAMVEMIMTMMKQQPGEIKEGVECLGITEEEFLKGYKKTLEICLPQDMLEGDCTQKEAPKQLGVSQEKFEKCAADDEEGTENTQGNDIDYSELSEEEAEALIAKQQAEGLAAMEAMLAISKQASAGTEDKITLPVYTPSTLVSHYTSGMKNSKGKSTLPVATFTTANSIEEVVAFYKKALPKFEIKKDGSYYFLMKNVPSNFDQMSLDMENLPLYFIPHIEIHTLVSTADIAATIVISYKPN